MDNQLSTNICFKHYRTYLGLSQMELATKMGTTQTTVARWESGTTPITPQVMQHIKVLVERKLYRDMRNALTRLKPDLTLLDFEGIFAVPSANLTIDERGKVYLGLVEFMGHREHAFYISVDDMNLYGIDRDNRAVLVDKEFVSKLRFRGVLQSRPEGKDDPILQRARIREIAEAACVGSEVVFDDGQPITWIRFRLDDLKSGRILGTPSGYYHVSEIADMSDDAIEKLIRALNPYAVKSAD